jgi:uncharacterized RDD family membrane protein YckC
MASSPHAAPSPARLAARTAAADTAAQAEATTADRSYAGFVTRAIAFAIDAAVIDGAALIVAAIAALASTVLYIGEDTKSVLLWIGAAAFILWAAGYFVSFWATTGRTLGNRVMYIRVVRAGDDRKLGYRRAIQRFVGLVLATFPLGLGVLPILFTNRRRGLQDVFGDSVVVHDGDRPEPRPGARPR